jgi:hypothetical protein
MPAFPNYTMEKSGGGVSASRAVKKRRKRLSKSVSHFVSQPCVKHLLDVRVCSCLQGSSRTSKRSRTKKRKGSVGDAVPFR